MNAQDKTFKGFLIIWLGQLMSAIGSGLTAFALGVFSKTLGIALSVSASGMLVSSLLGEARGRSFCFLLEGSIKIYKAENDSA